MSGGTMTPEARIGNVPIQQSSQGSVVPLVYGKNRVGVNLIWYGDFESVEKHQSQGGGKGGIDTVSYDYYAAIIGAVGQGTLNINRIWRAQQQYQTADIGDKLSLEWHNGAAGQGVWTWLQSHHAGTHTHADGKVLVNEDIGYSATAYIASTRYALAQGAQIPNHTVEVTNATTGPTPLPMSVISDLLTRCGISSSIVQATGVNEYAQAVGITCSPAITSATATADLIEQLAIINNVGIVPSEGKLKFVPYAAQAVGGFTPNLTPAYDLTDDDFIASGGDPITVTRKSEADTFNHVQCEYADGALDYNTSITEAKDDESIARSGLRTKDKITLLGVTDANVARLVAQQVLQREIAVRNEYEFTLTPRHVLLEPMDFVTLTDTLLGFNKLVVRVTEVDEQDDGTLKVKAEDAPLAAFNPALYAYQSNAGFVANYSVDPGNVTTPVFFEPPIELATATGLEVWCAVSGPSSNWGGCDVWVSMDGTNYKFDQTIEGGSRYGTLTAALGSGSTSGLSVALAGIGGQLLSGSAADATALNTLCWVGNASGGEFLAYQTATMTATNAYTLNGLVRGAYGSNSGAKTAGMSFVRVDKNGIGKSDPLDPAMIGKTIYFKFCSYNNYGARKQGLAEVSAYPYTITGSMLKLPPSGVTGLGLAVQTNGIRVSWNACPDVDYASTIIRVGTSFAGGTEVTNKRATSHLLPWQSAGVLTVWAAHVDQFGNVSTTPVSASITITAPAAVTGLVLASGTTGLQASWAMAALASTAQPVDRVELSWSSNFATVIDAKKATTASFPWRAPGLTELFVRVVDVAGNVGTQAMASLTVRSPSAPTALAMSIGNTGVQATWGAQAVAADQQPLGGIQLSWMADFSALIETRSATSVTLGWLVAGSYTLYARYTDAAGNSGTASSTTLTVAAPSAPASLALAFGTANIEAKWTAPAVAANQQPLDRVELSWGSAFTTVVDGKKSTTTTFGWMTAGSYTLYARYVDMAGNVGAVSQSALQVLAPNQPTMTSVETQVNAVTLRWQDAKTNQPIRKYAIYYGEAGTLIANASLYGSAGADSRSDILFYRSSGSKVAFLVAEDVAGNVGTPRQIDLTIKMPNDFVLASEYYEDWQPRELVNGMIIGNDVIQRQRYSTVGNLINKPTFEDGQLGGWGAAFAVYPTDGRGLGALSSTNRDVLEDGNTFAVSPGEQLACGGDIYSKGTAFNGNIGVMIKNASNQIIDWRGTFYTGDQSSWQTVGGWITMPAGAAYATPWLQIDRPLGTTGNETLFTNLYIGRQAAQVITVPVIDYSRGQVILPANNGRTWGQRLSNNGWTTAQQKVDAGYPIVVQPVPTSGKHVEQHDLGKVLAIGVVRVTPTLQSSVAGYVSTIRIRGSNGDTNASWQAWLVGDAASISNFRYLEVEYSVTSDGKGFVVLDDLAVKVEITEVTESTTLVLNATDTAGTGYTTTKPFLDVRTAQATPLGSSNIAKLNCIVDDSVLPAKVFVQAWDSSNTRTGGTVSLFIAGV
jgi:hypothetical protein